jgi:hypothetical protein
MGVVVTMNAVPARSGASVRPRLTANSAIRRRRADQPRRLPARGHRSGREYERARGRGNQTTASSGRPANESASAGAARASAITALFDRLSTTNSN